MKIDTIALIIAIAVVGLYILFMVFTAFSLGILGYVILIPLAIGAYLLAVVVQQRLNSKEDDYYEKIEK